MDLSRVNLILESNVDQLQNKDYVENLIIRLGFNTEVLVEQPKIVIENGGGLLIWQYPSQFAKYLLLLQKQKISSYLEIGCRWGGTFVLTTEYLKKFNTIENSTAIDIIDSPVKEYCDLHNNTYFVKISSQDENFKNYMKMTHFDLIFIDGDHSYEGVKNDYEVSKNSGKIFVFHDIVNVMCPGVVQFWKELQQNEPDRFDFFEFTDQYEDVLNNTHASFLGIGVAITK